MCLKVSNNSEKNVRRRQSLEVKVGIAKIYLIIASLCNLSHGVRMRCTYDANNSLHCGSLKLNDVPLNLFVRIGCQVGLRRFVLVSSMITLIVGASKGETQIDYFVRQYQRRSGVARGWVPCRRRQAAKIRAPTRGCRRVIDGRRTIPVKGKLLAEAGSVAAEVHSS